MPYFVYKIYPNRTLDYIESFDKYRDAKNQTRSLRSELNENDTHTFRLIYAAHEAEAKRLLLIKREERPAGEE